MHLSSVSQKNSFVRMRTFATLCANGHEASPPGRPPIPQPSANNR
jgi:hypothetical protein